MPPSRPANATGPRVILFVHDGQDWIRGSERCLLDLVAGVDRSRFTPVVACSAPTLARAAEAEGAVAHLLAPWDACGERLLPLRRQVRELEEIVDRHGVALVHANAIQPLKSLLPVVRARQLPLLAHLHIVHPRETRLYTGLHQVTLAVGVSEAAVAGLREDGLDPARIRVIYNGVDPCRLDGGESADLRRRLALPAHAPLLVALGSLIARKGVDVLLRALPALAATHPQAHLVLAGEGAQRAEYERLATELGVADRVHFLGECREVGPVLRECDVAVSAARQEAFPLNLLEAAYCGLPIVASDIGPHRESVVEGETGVLVPLEDPSAMAAAVGRLLDDPAMRLRMGEAGARRVRERFLLSHYVDAFERVYEELLARPRSRYGWVRGGTWPRAYWDWLGGAARRRLPLGARGA